MTREPIEPKDWERLEALWDLAVTLSPEERIQLFEAQNVHGALRDECESLLARTGAAQEFFNRLQSVVRDSAYLTAEPRDDSDVSTSTPDVDPMIGITIGHYRIDARLGQGGMGIVYRATDLRLRRTVALKLLRAQTPDDPHATERLLTEARAAAALDHPNICTIYEVGETADQLSFIAMAFYPGETLEQSLRRGPLPIATVVDYATQIARGLGAAHQRGTIHRDVKPANVVVTTSGVLKLLDFGIARTLEIGASHDSVTPGTIAYMSPEQITSRNADQRSDLWALGVVLYEMCTGVRPFDGQNAGAILYAIVHGAPRPATSLREHLPPELASIIDRLLSKKPEERYENSEDLIDDLLLSVAPRHQVKASARVGRKVGLVVALVASALVLSLPMKYGPIPSDRRLAAQDLYAQGHRDVLFRTESGRREALVFFKQAIAVDSTFATAHADLAHLLVLISDNAGASRRDRLREAEAAARTAIRLDSSLANAHAALGDVLLSEFHLAEAESEFRRAVALDPMTPYVREFLVWVYVFMNRPADALDQAERAAAENPTLPTAIAEHARGLLVNGRCNDAMPLLAPLMFLQPRPARVGSIAAQCYLLQGKTQEAIDAVRPVAEQSPLQGNPWLSFMLARAGDVGGAREMRDSLLEQWRRGESGAYGVAVAYAGLGDFDRAFEWLDRSIEDGSLRYNIMEPAFADLRRDARFERVRQRLGIRK